MFHRPARRCLDWLVWLMLPPLREIEELHSLKEFSDNGNDRLRDSWKCYNCRRDVLGIYQCYRGIEAPALISIYDDGYGISVTNEHQIC